MSAGIDYGRGMSNIDTETGIRYGVISQNDVIQVWADSSDPDYGDPTCPVCGNTVLTMSEAELSDARVDVSDWSQYSGLSLGGGCAEYACSTCEHTLDSQDVFGDEPAGFTYDDGGYLASTGLDNDIMIIKSPYYTLARFCSPCVPGAGDLNNTIEDGVKSYCFGHEWFDDNEAPYPVYEVATGKLVSPPKFYECGICGHCHPWKWNGDCRDDVNRFTHAQLDEKYGLGCWTEMSMDDRVKADQS